MVFYICSVKVNDDHFKKGKKYTITSMDNNFYYVNSEISKGLIVSKDCLAITSGRLVVKRKAGNTNLFQEVQYE